MSLTPIPDRRQQPRIPGMIVTQPADLDDGQPLLHIPDLGRAAPTGHRTCDEPGVCQGRGDCDCPTPDQAGNLWLAEPEPMSLSDKIGLTTLIVISACAAVSAVGWLLGSVAAQYVGLM